MRKKPPCKSRVVGLMHTRGMCLEVLSCGHTMYPLPRRANWRICRKCQRGSTDFDCDPMDYCRMKSMDEVEDVRQGEEVDGS
jgi:hypothetical protein